MPGGANHRQARQNSVNPVPECHFWHSRRERRIAKNEVLHMVKTVTFPLENRPKMARVAMYANTPPAR